MNESILNELKHQLQLNHHCHSMILYGSFADGTNNDDSDIDVVCFSDQPIQSHDVSVIQGHPLDAWIYPTEKMNDPSEFLHIHAGIILRDDKKRCVPFLNQIETLIKTPVKVSDDEKAFLKAWMQKMLKRSLRGDSEGDFRAHWLLVDALEIYFKLRDQRYLGPKKALIWLKENDPLFFKAYSLALKPGSQAQSTHVLIERFFTDVTK